MSTVITDRRIAMRSRLLAAGLAASLAAGLPATALAHEEVAVGAGLVNGLLHPVLGPDHLIAMVAVGLWGAQLGAPLIWALPIAFPLMMAVGGVLGVIGVDVPSVEVGIAASALVLGLFVLSAFRAPVWLAVVVVSVFAIFHGHAHGSELPHTASPLAYGIGFVTSTGLLHLAGILIGLLNGVGSVGPAVVRACGGVVAALGGYFLTLSLGLL
ncbi:MAG: HupE/UreJ family protein [Alphaproteobacteria bacterium]